MHRFVPVLFALIFSPILIAQAAMNNDSVIKLAKAGLSDDVIVATVSSSAGTYDTSADGLIALKQAGVSDKVIAAMVTKAAGPTQPAPSAATAGSGLPAGIDGVGVYYKDKNGSWVSIMSEVVNFKTGGMMKSFATNGLIKGDVNGHIEGAHAKLNGTLPFVFAIYTPEGTEATEYQLLRLRSNSNNREFRSVTGGVIHSSGGAKRDSIEFEPKKLASRLYEITIGQELGKGEYGILPPGSTASSNMASGGKIYSVSIIE
jgi:hypothetical protein